MVSCAPAFTSYAATTGTSRSASTRRGGSSCPDDPDVQAVLDDLSAGRRPRPPPRPGTGCWATCDAPTCSARSRRHPGLVPWPWPATRARPPRPSGCCAPQGSSGRRGARRPRRRGRLGRTPPDPGRRPPPGRATAPGGRGRPARLPGRPVRRARAHGLPALRRRPSRRARPAARGGRRAAAGRTAAPDDPALEALAVTWAVRDALRYLAGGPVDLVGHRRPRRRARPAAPVVPAPALRVRLGRAARRQLTAQ